jgi:hypothetical protein
MDQLNSYYNFYHKGIRWTHRIYSHFLGVSVVNACILYNNSNPLRRLTSIEFFDDVIKSMADLDKTHNWNDLDEELGEIQETASEDLMDGIATEVEDEPTIASVATLQPKGKVFRRYRKKNLEGKVERLEGIHVPVLLKSSNRRRCVFHPDTKQRYFCETCDVALCLSDCAEDSCWYKYHHEESWKDL